MNEVVTIAPWSPLPLVLPAVLAVLAVVASSVGTHRDWKGVREGGYVAFIVAALAGFGMWWSLSGMWDTSQRQQALIELGYESPTFSSSAAVAESQAEGIGFQAVRDGERVRGVLLHVEDDQWEVREVPEDED